MFPHPSYLQEFATRYTEAWCSQEPVRVAQFFAPSGSLTINDGSPAVGRDAIAESARSFMSAFPDLLVTFEDLRFAVDSVEYHWRLTGSNNGPGGSGRRVEIRGMEVWKFGDDGLIAESRGSFDQSDYDRQLRPTP